MLYMGNVNRAIFWFFIPFVLFIYVAYRVLDWQINLRYGEEQRLRMADIHLSNLRELNNVNCLIIGGSNSVFSLSAEQLSNQNDLNCYNLSLFQEGGSDNAYFNYITKISTDPLQIKKVFYSSYYAASQENFALRLERNKDKRPIEGKNDFSLVGQSLAYRLKYLIDYGTFYNLTTYPDPTERGDFNFDLFNGCDNSSVNDTFKLPIVDSSYTNWIVGNLTRLQNFFPNAEVYNILPSTLRMNITDQELHIFSKSLSKVLTDHSFRYIEQSAYPSKNVLCDATHHANSIGREMRTSELLSLLE